VGGSSAGSSPDAGTTTSSTGCGNTPKLRDTPSTTTFNANTVTINGKDRQFFLRLPDNYDKNHPYRLIISLHGAGGNGSNTVKEGFFGLSDLGKTSTIFVGPSSDGLFWASANDLPFVDEILKQVKADLCVDTSQIILEGFSQGAALAYTLACMRPNVYRAAVVHSGGSMNDMASVPSTCQPIAYFSSLGQQENDLGQTMTSDAFAKTDGCTIETLPKAPSGGHLCSDYKGCKTGSPVRWCPYDGGHTPSPNDSGQNTSWMPKEVWTFLSAL
jgi:predicted esterase